MDTSEVRLGFGGIFQMTIFRRFVVHSVSVDIVNNVFWYLSIRFALSIVQKTNVIQWNILNCYRSKSAIALVFKNM